MMRIAVIAHLRHPIAPPFKGGMEAHCHALVTALQAAGHDVTLFASGDSDPTLPIVAATPSHYEAVLPWAHWHGTPALTAFSGAGFRHRLERRSRRANSTSFTTTQCTPRFIDGRSATTFPW